MTNAIKYLFAHRRTLLYFALSIFLSVIFTILTKTTFRIEALFIFFLLPLLMRIADDKHDYDSDAARGKRQDLSKKELLVLFIVLSAIFVIIHTVAFGAWGLVSVIFCIYIQLEELIEILQRFFMLILSCYYLFLLGGTVDLSSAAVIAWLLFSLISPIFFAFYKRRKNK